MTALVHDFVEPLKPLPYKLTSAKSVERAQWPEVGTLFVTK